MQQRAPVNMFSVQRVLSIHIVALLCCCVLSSSNSTNTCPAGCVCVHENSTACSRLGWTQLPEQIPRFTIILDLSHNAFASLPESLATLSVLTSLNMSHNNVSAVYLTSPTLCVLDVSNNCLDNLSNINQLFQTCAQLRTLDLSHNKLHITNSKLARLASHSLEELAMRECNLTVIPDHLIQDLVVLSSLDLSGNPIRTFTDLQSKSLVELTMTSCHLKSVSYVSRDSLPKLTTLRLDDNEQLQMFRVESDSLQNLYLAGCSIKEVPLNVSTLPELRVLDLRSNQIQHVRDHAFVRSRELREILLAGNFIESVHSTAFARLEQLHRVDLSVNRITRLAPDTFRTAFRLRELHASRNYLASLRLYADALQYLDVSACEIAQVNATDLDGTPVLKALNVSRNPIWALPNQLRAEVLDMLDASQCRISRISNVTFARAQNLRYIDLRGNRLSADVTRDMFFRAQKVMLSDNPWRCECDKPSFRALFTWLREKASASDHDALRCQSPEMYDGKLWVEACDRWFPVSGGTFEFGFAYGLVGCLVLVLFAWVVVCTVQFWKQKREEQERIERTHTQRAEERVRLERMHIEARRIETINRNAPDPRDSPGPPTYAEAMLAPIPESVRNSTASLGDSCPALHIPKYANGNGEVDETTTADTTRAARPVGAERQRRQRKRPRNRREPSVRFSTQAQSTDDEANETAQTEHRLPLRSKASRHTYESGV